MGQESFIWSSFTGQLSPSSVWVCRQTVLKVLVSALATDGVCPVIMSDVLEDQETSGTCSSPDWLAYLPTAISEEMLRHSVHAFAAVKSGSGGT